MADSGEFGWLSQEQWLALGVAGCVTVASGSTSQEALAAFGGDAAAVVSVGSVSAQAAPSLAGVCDLAGGGVLVVEPNGFQGARHEVLRRVSTQGAAAVVQWGLNGSVYFRCARTGRVICLVDLLLDDELAGVPAKLKRLVPHERVEADLVAVGAAMAATFVSVEFSETALAAIETLHVLSPVLADLALIPPSSSMLRYDDPELLALIVSADLLTHRALAQWAAVQAVAQSLMAGDHRVGEIVAQFGTGRPPRVTAGLTQLAQLIEREFSLAEVRDPFRRSDQGASGLEYTWARQRSFALEALRYCCEPDPLIAVIGAVDCADTCCGINGVDAAFRTKATLLLTGNPNFWHGDAVPLPDPPTPEQRATELLAEADRIAEFEAAEKPWSFDLPDDARPI